MYTIDSIYVIVLATLSILIVCSVPSTALHRPDVRRVDIYNIIAKEKKNSFPYKRVYDDIRGQRTRFNDVCQKLSFSVYSHYMYIIIYRERSSGARICRAYIYILRRTCTPKHARVSRKTERGNYDLLWTHRRPPAEPNSSRSHIIILLSYKSSNRPRDRNNIIIRTRR